MECPLSSLQHGATADTASDYGSDFTAEEEALVNELLTKLASGEGNAKIHPSKNLDHDEEPSAAKVPRILGVERWSRTGTPMPSVEEAGMSVAIERDVTAAKGKRFLPTRLNDRAD